MMETVAVYLGMAFVGTIVICLVWTICSYIADAKRPCNKLEENIRKWEEKTR